MRSCAIPLYPAQDMNHLFIQSLQAVDTQFPAGSSLSSHLSDQIDCCGITVLVFKSPLLYLAMAQSHLRNLYHSILL